MKMFFVVLVAILFFGCTDTIDAPKKETGRGYSIILIDGCEYIVVDEGFGNHRVYAIAHKGDCKNPFHKK